MPHLSVRSLHLLESKLLSSEWHIRGSVESIWLWVEWFWTWNEGNQFALWNWFDWIPIGYDFSIHWHCSVLTLILNGYLCGIPIKLLKPICIKENQQTVTEPSGSRRGAIEEPSRSSRGASGRVKQRRPESMGVKETSSWPGSCQGMSSSLGKQL